MTTYTNDIDVLRGWVGRSETSVATIDASACQRLADTLGHDVTISSGDLLPPLWHFIFHAKSVPVADLDTDGHPKRGGFLPPVLLPRRMWASGEIEFHDGIAVGDTVTKTSTVTAVEAKSGRSGDLCFVTVHHELAVDGSVRISEDQNLVYRAAPTPDAPPRLGRPAPEHGDFSREFVPSEVLLFRYSALTNNSHRIHYDRDYASSVEGYGGLVVHGPLTATLLALLALSEVGRPLTRFSFRGVAPLLDTAAFTVAGTQADDLVELWAADSSGNLAMTATARF